MAEKKIEDADGGPAFPQPKNETDQFVNLPAHPGMKLRDYFAAKARVEDVYQAEDGCATIPVPLGVRLIGRTLPGFDDGPIENARWWCEVVAAWRYMQADAMLAARARVKPAASTRFAPWEMPGQVEELVDVAKLILREAPRDFAFRLRLEEAIRDVERLGGGA